ncbi:hypothetical protein [Chromohalobacter israelensis]|uniref:hypothetical protein n=1 Tax=Chromohalobacter israelensis TaxID=141390 RepID=UPI00351D0A3F
MAEVERQLKQKGPIGRRPRLPDAGTQSRANTLTSNPIVADTTRCAVELKVLIEQMRNTE